MIRSSISIPLRVEDGWHGALIVYAATPNAFEAPAIKVLQHLAEQIVYAVHALDQGAALQAREIDLINLQRKLTEALSAMVAPMAVSYTHLDVYKRQAVHSAHREGAIRALNPLHAQILAHVQFVIGRDQAVVCLLYTSRCV